MRENNVGVMRGSYEEKKGLFDLIAYISEKIDVTEQNLLEIGSYSGESSLIFSKSFKRVICVDPWDDKLITDGCFYANKAPLSEVERVFDENMSRKSYTKYKMTSDDFFRYINEDYKIVYIDGLHTYEQVKKDIENSISKGVTFISGHDYCKTYWNDVVRAIHDTVGEPDRIFVDKSWIKCLI